MKKSVILWQLVGFLFTSVLGSLLHFVFDWSRQSTIVALFAPVNESTWEHMKLMFFPMFLFALAENRRIGAEFSTFWCVKLKGILIGLLLIPVIYYTYTGILGTSAEWFNILSFFLAAGAAYLWETRQLTQGAPCSLSPALSLVLIFGIGILFMVLTFYPPHIPLFRDSPTGTYGLGQ